MINFTFYGIEEKKLKKKFSRKNLGMALWLYGWLYTTTHKEK